MATEDPIPYDPLNYRNLAESVVRALLEKELSGLPPEVSFEGAGVYAIYYTGMLPFYAAISSAECHAPIYVGKAIPTGGRKGTTSTAAAGGRPLYKRLKEHAKSIEQAENLSLTEFRCRYLVTVPVWIPLAERFLIEHFRPLWNTLIDGFGNHPPGAGRKGMRRPRWDILHPGRPWAKDLAPADTPEGVISLIESAKR